MPGRSAAAPAAVFGRPASSSDSIVERRREKIGDARGQHGVRANAVSSRRAATEFAKGAESSGSERDEGAAFGAQSLRPSSNASLSRQSGVDQRSVSEPVVSPTMALTSVSVTVCFRRVEEELFELAADGEAVAAEFF